MIKRKRTLSYVMALAAVASLLRAGGAATTQPAEPWNEHCTTCPGTQVKEVAATQTQNNQHCSVESHGEGHITITVGTPATQGSFGTSGGGTNSSDCWTYRYLAQVHNVDDNSTGTAQRCTYSFFDGEWLEQEWESAGCDTQLMGTFPGRYWVLNCRDEKEGFPKTVGSPHPNKQQDNCVMTN